MRRAFVEHPLVPGPLRLSGEQSHHLRNVLRLEIGHTIELFNPQNQSANAEITSFDDGVVIVQVGAIREQRAARNITIAAAVPKGDRADWMIEKLSEIGVTRFIPLATQRSVVLPSGEAKFERWRRIATEASKQSKRPGVMQIDPLTKLGDCLNAGRAGIYLSTEERSESLGVVLASSNTFDGGEDRVTEVTPPRERSSPNPESRIANPCLLIGPEGGWSESELVDFRARGLTAARLTATILRTETAAIAAAVIAAAL